MQKFVKSGEEAYIIALTTYIQSQLAAMTFFAKNKLRSKSSLTLFHEYCLAGSVLTVDYIICSHPAVS
jgi:hypothetical protein